MLYLMHKECMGLSSALDYWLKKDEVEALESPDYPVTERVAIIEALTLINQRTGFYRMMIQEGKSLLMPLHRKDPKSKIIILDVGAGGGGLLQSLSKWAHAHKVPVELTGLDLDPDFAEQSRARLQKLGISANLIFSDATDLSNIADNSFDIVLSSYLMHHIRDLPTAARLVAEIKRIARHGWLVVDLDRKYRGVVMMFGALLLGAPWPLVRDGIRSVRRAYRPAEINGALDALKAQRDVQGLRCQSVPPFPYWKIKGSKTA